MNTNTEHSEPPKAGRSPRNAVLLKGELGKCWLRARLQAGWQQEPASVPAGPANGTFFVASAQQVTRRPTRVQAR